MNLQYIKNPETYYNIIENLQSVSKVTNAYYCSKCLAVFHDLLRCPECNSTKIREVKII